MKKPSNAALLLLVASLAQACSSGRLESVTTSDGVEHSSESLTVTAPALVTPSVTAPGTSVIQTKVAANGSLEVKLPLLLPPGTAGVEPRLSLSYDGNQMHDGPMGVGWGVEGLSSITRCGKTPAQDGTWGTVQNDASDRFCLDGQRLVAVGGTSYGAAGASYRLELDNASEILQNGLTAAGPDSFTMWTKSGLRMDYGSTADSRIESNGAGNPVRTWALARVTDTKGNYFTVTYGEDTANGEHAPLRIDYTGNTAAGLAPQLSVRFGYEANSGPTVWEDGAKTTRTIRLRAVDTFVGTQRARQWQLSYDAGTGRSRLTSVRECAWDGRCYAPTQFSWTHGNLGTNAWAGWGSVVLDGKELPIDMNGDGKTDLLQLTTDGRARVALSTGSSFGAFADWGTGTSGDRARLNVADVTGDGLLDLVQLGSDGVAKVWVSNGTALLAPATWGTGFSSDATRIHLADVDGDQRVDIVQVDTGGSVSVAPSTGAAFGARIATSIGHQNKPGNVVIGDLTGDGRADILEWVSPTTTTETFKVWPSMGTGFGAASNWLSQTQAYLEGAGAPIKLADVNGDNLPDLVRTDLQVLSGGVWVPGVAAVWLSTGRSFLPRVNWATGIGIDPMLMDLNGDGKTDLLAPGSGASRVAWLSTGTSFSNAGDWTTGSPPGMAPRRVNVRTEIGPSWLSGYPLALSGEKYGTPDVICQDVGLTRSVGFGCVYNYGYPVKYLAGGQWYYDGEMMSSGGGWCGSNTSPSYVEWVDCASDRLMVFDASGDGIADVVAIAANASPQVALGKGPFPDLINVVTDGMGAQWSIAYRPSSDTNVYTKGTTAPANAMRALPAFPIVATVGRSDGIGGVSSVTYRYSGLAIDKTGRGSLGFATITTTEPTGIQTTTTLRQDFPYVGLASSIVKKTSGGTVLSTSTRTYATHDTQTCVGGVCARRYLPYMAGETVTSVDLNGAALPTLNTTQTVDTFGNVTSHVVKTTSGATIHTVTTASTFTNASQRVGRLTAATTTYALTGKPSITRSTSYTYDAAGLLLTETVEPAASFARVVRHTYDAFGNRIQTDVTAGGVTRITKVAFDTSGRLKVSETNAAGHITKYAYGVPALSLPTTVTDPNNVAMTMAYDSLGHKTSETRGGITETLTRALCGTCPTHAKMVAHSDKPGRPRITAYVDALLREVRSETRGHANRIVRTDKEYDALGRVRRQSRPYFAADASYPGDTIQWTSFTYDVLNRPTQVTEPDLGVTTIAYNGLERRTTNPKNQIAIETNNVLAKVARAEQGRVGATAGSATTFDYDAAGNVVQTTDAKGIVRTTTYDVRGLRIGSTDPDHGNRTYTYNGFDELTSIVDAKSQTVTMTYDALGRLKSRTEPEGVTTYTYDTAINGVGLLASVSAPGSVVRSIAYDTLQRPSSTSLTLDGQTFTTSTTYDSAGRTATVTYPSGLVVGYTYDATHGKVSQLRDMRVATAPKTLWSATTRNAEGHVTAITYGNGLTGSRTFDPKTGNVTGLKVQNGTTVLDDIALGYDIVDNLTSRSNATTAVAETFAYDALQRLTSFSRGTTVAGTYAYDAVGNFTQKSDVGAYAYTGSRLSSIGRDTYSYDANGNVLSGAGRTLTWTSFNMPKTIVKGTTTLTFSYDGDHARIKQVAPSGTTYYADAGSYEKTGTTHRHYLKVEGESVGELTISGATSSMHYHHTDHLGSLSLVTTETGAIAERLSWDPWGARRLTNGQAGPVTSAFRRGFTGHEQLDSVGLVHMNGRVYDPVIGRFLSADPVTQEPTNSQNYARYAYVFDNPLTHVDPTGYFSFKKFFRQFLAAVIGFIITIALPYLSPIFAGFWGGVLAGAIGGAVAGAISGGGIKSILYGALGGAVWGGVGFGLKGVGNIWIKAITHAVVGGTLEAIQGGNFVHGAMANGFGTFLGNLGPVKKLGFIGRLAAATIAGGTAAAVSGGKFENGAVSSAFGYLFNDLAHTTAQLAIDLAPVTGWISSAYSLVTGKEIATGESTSRWWAAIGVVTLGYGNKVRFLNKVPELLQAARHGDDYIGVQAVVKDVNITMTMAIRSDGDKLIIENFGIFPEGWSLRTMSMTDEQMEALDTVEMAKEFAGSIGPDGILALRRAFAAEVKKAGFEGGAELHGWDRLSGANPGKKEKVLKIK